MTTVAKHTYIGAPFSNQIEVCRATYDFASDGGAQGVLVLFTASSACLIRSFTGTVKAGVTSDGSLTLDCGTNTTADRFVDGRAKASLLINTTLPTESDAAMPAYLAAGETVSMSILDADATAGKIEFIVEVMKP